MEVACTSNTPYPHLPPRVGRGCAVVGCCPGSPILLAIPLSNLIFGDLAAGALLFSSSLCFLNLA